MKSMCSSVDTVSSCEAGCQTVLIRNQELLVPAHRSNQEQGWAVGHQVSAHVSYIWTIFTCSGVLSDMFLFS